MEERELAEVVEQQQYFEAVPAPSPEEDEGTRDMGPLYPFLISGGTNTERYYFTHIMILQSISSISDPSILLTSQTTPRPFPKESKRY